MMPITPGDRLSFQQSLRDTRVFGRTIALLFPTFTECPIPGCGFDEKNDTAINPSCATCNGLGQIASSWAISLVHANIRMVDQSLMTFGKAPPGATVGDTFITVDPRAHELFANCFEDKDSYIVIDGQRYRPKDIDIAGVGHIEEYVIVLASFKATYTAQGY